MLSDTCKVAGFFFFSYPFGQINNLKKKNQDIQKNNEHDDAKKKERKEEKKRELRNKVGICRCY